MEGEWRHLGQQGEYRHEIESRNGHILGRLQFWMSVCCRRRNSDHLQFPRSRERLRRPAQHPGLLSINNMLFFSVFAWFLAVACAAKLAERDDDTTSSSASSSGSSASSSSQLTTVWVTITTNGALATVKSLYTQQFTLINPVSTEVPSASAGMGSLSGSVGEIRSYLETTVNGGNAPPRKEAAILGGSVALGLALVGLL